MHIYRGVAGQVQWLGIAAMLPDGQAAPGRSCLFPDTQWPDRSGLLPVFLRTANTQCSAKIKASIVHLVQS